MLDRNFAIEHFFIGCMSGTTGVWLRTRMFSV
jgi:hypothetical protein